MHQGGVVVHLSVTSSLEAREVRICTQAPHLNATKHSEGIFEILLGAELQGPRGNTQYNGLV